MRASIGLSPPERRIGQSAHDFAQSLGCRDLILTRATKRGDSPTVPSRFIQRLQAYMGPEAWGNIKQHGKTYLDYARALDAPEEIQLAPSATRPAPIVPPDLFPKRLNVSQAETLFRNPYALYAQHVLKLDPLDPVGTTPNAATRGIMLHDILAQFGSLYPDTIPPDADKILTHMGEQAFAPLMKAFPGLYALWWPKFQRLIPAYLAFEQRRRLTLATLYVEQSGRLPITLQGGHSLTLSSRADRIEVAHDGRITLLDYKTGTVPGKKDVQLGLSPQLTLEAALLQRGAFTGIAPTGTAPELLYVNISGGREPLKETIPTAPKDYPDMNAMIEEHFTGLVETLNRLVTGEEGFTSWAHPKQTTYISAYDHLARVKEWSIFSDDEETINEAEAS
jgi:ATP-dependent helicase/nuclease subunit B